MSDVNLSISQDVVRPIIEAKIQAAIVKELEGSAGILEKVVARVLMAKVDTEGKESCYARETTFVQWACHDAIRRATVDAVREVAEKMKPQLQAQIIKELEARKKEIAGSLVSLFKDASCCRIEPKITIIPA